jgi:protein SCO1/2
MVTAGRADAKPTGWAGMRRHIALFIACALGAPGLVGAAMVLHVGPWAEEPLPVFWAMPSFNLTDQQGRPFGSADLNGRAALFSFVYTNCPDVCPLLTSNMAQIQNRLRTRGLLDTKVELVSVTVDPRRDTPSVLAEYASRYHAEADAWRFLSGEPASIYEVLWGFKLNTVEVARAFEGADVVPHASRFVVVDPSGQVRGQPMGDQKPIDDIVRMVERVAP